MPLQSTESGQDPAVLPSTLTQKQLLAVQQTADVQALLALCDTSRPHRRWILWLASQRATANAVALLQILSI